MQPKKYLKIDDDDLFNKEIIENNIEEEPTELEWEVYSCLDKDDLKEQNDFFWD
jgi:hypothetical protein